jgi:hypothetical protein
MARGSPWPARATCVPRSAPGCVAASCSTRRSWPSRAASGGELSLDGGFLTYDGLRCPPLGDRDRNPKEDPRAALENDLFLRVADMESAIDVLDRLFAEFCRVRGSSTWSHETLPSLRAWVDGLR